MRVPMSTSEFDVNVGRTNDDVFHFSIHHAHEDDGTEGNCNCDGAVNHVVSRVC